MNSQAMKIIDKINNREISVKQAKSEASKTCMCTIYNFNAPINTYVFADGSKLISDEDIVYTVFMDKAV